MVSLGSVVLHHIYDDEMCFQEDVLAVFGHNYTANA